MAERPVECSRCKKPAKVIYKEIVGKTIVTTEMCADCPVLEQKLHGEVLSAKHPEPGTGVSCAGCLTTLESVKTGNPLGCSECYNVFADLLVTQLIESNSIPSRLKKTLHMKRTQKLYVGQGLEKKAPQLGASSRLIELNEALNEALKRENYEQAAWIRDQIKELEKQKSPDERKG